MTQRPKKKNKSRGSSLDRDGERSDDRALVEFESAGTGKRWNLLIVAIFIVGYFLRVLFLDWKPPHFDEGINGFFVAKMWKEGYYHYDPTNFHGPLYFYVLLIAELVFGRTVVAYRFATGLIALAAIGLMVRHRRFFGATAIWAAGLCAVSAGCVFYSRYAIHESLFIFLQVLFSYGYFMWREEKSRRAVGLMAIGFFGLYAVKETYFIFVGTWLIAAFIEKIWSTKIKRDARPPLGPADLDEQAALGFWRQRAQTSDWVSMIGLGMLFEYALYTGFFINPQGARDMIESVLVWTKTGTAGNGHEKPPIYWLQLLSLYELPSLVSLALAIPLFFFSKSRMRQLILVSVGLFLAYTIIPYKTPWLILNMLWPLSFVFGALLMGGRRLALSRPGAVWGVRAGWLLALVLVGVMFTSTLRVNFLDYANEKEKYVYVQSTLQMKKVLDVIESRVKAYPEDLNMRLLVLVRDPWPLPWVFGNYPNLTYGKPDSADLRLPTVVLIDGKDQGITETRLMGKYFRIPFRIRDSYDNGWAYLDYEKFKTLVAGQFSGDNEVIDRPVAQ